MSDHIKTTLYINGKWRAADDGRTFEILNPATEESVGTAALAGKKDTLMAIDAAAEGFEVWRKVPAWERSKVLRKLAQFVAERTDEMARRLTLECGKPLGQSKAELGMAVDSIDWFADEARRIFGTMIEGRVPGQRFLVSHKPVGVVGAFTAWNFPIALTVRKIVPALAAGCSIIVRPAEEGTGAVALLMQAIVDAGVPAGVVNLLTGPPVEISDTIMASDVVRKVSFTGSIPVGQELIRKSADTVKKISMELGGHAPVIIFDDVDIEQVAITCAAGKTRNNGQVCVSPTRFFVHESKKAAFTESFVGALQSMKIGNGLDTDTDIGPLINKRRLEAIESMTQSTLDEGARLLTGGKRPANMNRGFYFEPTVFDNVSDDARVMNEEPFGPLAPLTSFSDFDEVVERANRLNVGLAGYVFTGSLKRANDCIDSIETGILGINTFAAATAEAPFGGIKHSGFGRENGTQGITDYLDIRFANMVMPR